MDFYLDGIRSAFDDAVNCPAGSACFVVDRGGFLLLDPSNDNILQRPDPVFFATRDIFLARLARTMLNLGLMERKDCLDYNSISRQQFFEMRVNETATGSLVCNLGKFVITPVPRSTFFMVGLFDLVRSQACSEDAELPGLFDLAWSDPCSGSFLPEKKRQRHLPSCPGAAVILPPNSFPVLSTEQRVGVVIGTIVFAALVVIIIVLASIHYGCTYCKKLSADRAAAKAEAEKPYDPDADPPAFRRKGSSLGQSSDSVLSRPNMRELAAKNTFLDIELYENSKPIPLEPVYWVTCSK